MSAAIFVKLRFPAAVSNPLPCRFMADSKEILDKLEACFEALAECAHTVDSRQKPLEEPLVVLFVGLPCFLFCIAPRNKPVPLHLGHLCVIGCFIFSVML